MSLETPTDNTPVADTDRRDADGDDSHTEHAERARSQDGPTQHENTTDATQGQPLASRAEQRRAELVTALGTLADDQIRERTDIERALTTVDQLLTDHHKHLSTATSASLNRWLERNKHLAETPSGLRSGDSPE